MILLYLNCDVNCTFNCTFNVIIRVLLMRTSRILIKALEVIFNLHTTKSRVEIN